MDLHGQKPVHRGRGLLLHIGEYMTVDIKGEPDTTMAQQLTYHFEMHPLGGWGVVVSPSVSAASGDGFLGHNSSVR
jgi:hypothetical protein